MTDGQPSTDGHGRIPYLAVVPANHRLLLVSLQIRFERKTGEQNSKLTTANLQRGLPQLLFPVAYHFKFKLNSFIRAGLGPVSSKEKKLLHSAALQRALLDRWFVWWFLRVGPCPCVNVLQDSPDKKRCIKTRQTRARVHRPAWAWHWTWTWTWTWLDFRVDWTGHGKQSGSVQPIRGRRKKQR